MPIGHADFWKAIAIFPGAAEAVAWADRWKLSDAWWQEITEWAAEHGYLQILTFTQCDISPAPITSWALGAAIQGGHIGVVQYLYRTGLCKLHPEDYDLAIAGGSLPIVLWLHEQNVPWSTGACMYAAMYKRMDILRWARAQIPPAPWDELTCSQAALGGHLNMLQELRMMDPPAPWNESVCTSAEVNGHYPIIRWAHRNGVPCIETSADAHLVRMKKIFPISQLQTSSWRKNRHKLTKEAHKKI